MGRNHHRQRRHLGRTRLHADVCRDPRPAAGARRGRDRHGHAYGAGGRHEDGGCRGCGDSERHDVEEGCYSCWSNDGRASGVVAVSELVAKHERVWFWIRGPFWINPAQPRNIGGALCEQFGRNLPTCFFCGTQTGCIFRNYGLALPLDFDDGNAAAFIFASGN